MSNSKVYTADKKRGTRHPHPIPTRLLLRQKLQLTIPFQCFTIHAGFLIVKARIGALAVRASTTGAPTKTFACRSADTIRSDSLTRQNTRTHI